MKKKSERLPTFKKNIKDFLLSEEGKITKKDIVKIGMGLAVLGMMFPATPAQAQHINFFFSDGRGGHTSHSSHASHGSHCNSRWCL
jgi:hypothetical protein